MKQKIQCIHLQSLQTSCYLHCILPLHNFSFLFVSMFHSGLEENLENIQYISRTGKQSPIFSNINTDWSGAKQQEMVEPVQ